MVKYKRGDFMRASFNINNKMTMIAEMRNDTVFKY